MQIVAVLTHRLKLVLIVKVYQVLLLQVVNPLVVKILPLHKDLIGMNLLEHYQSIYWIIGSPLSKFEYPIITVNIKHNVHAVCLEGYTVVKLL